MSHFDDYTAFTYIDHLEEIERQKFAKTLVDKWMDSVWSTSRNEYVTIVVPFNYEVMNYVNL